MEKRERFGSRLGFILVSAGCAVGLGNVWKFPYMCGQYGGAAFILIYLLFLVILGFPIMICEFSVGRASQRSVADSFRVLEKPGTKYHLYSYFGMVGNYMLMMFYTSVTGWLLYYMVRMAGGSFAGATPQQVEQGFGTMLQSPKTMTCYMILAVLLAFGICSLGLKNGVEKITKLMMICLLGLMVILVFRVVILPGAGEGIRFYLLPNFEAMKEIGVGNVIFGAMSQAFFTLSIGIGAMAIFGSYLDKNRSLSGEALSILCLDTVVAILAGFIVIPASFAFHIPQTAGPSLIFISLPNIFEQMPGGAVWGTLFFLFLSFAALSTVVAVFENILSFAVDLFGWTRKKAVAVNIILLILLSMPCVLGFNVLANIMPLGAGSNIMDLEDFIVSNNLLPLGSIVYLMFCTSRYGWGWQNFLGEANSGEGIKLPAKDWLRSYMTYILPAIVIIIYVKGYWDKFGPAQWDQGVVSRTAGCLWLGVGAVFLIFTAYISFCRQKGSRRSEIADRSRNGEK